MLYAGVEGVSVPLAAIHDHELWYVDGGLQYKNLDNGKDAHSKDEFVGCPLSMLSFPKRAYVLSRGGLCREYKTAANGGCLQNASIHFIENARILEKKGMEHVLVGTEDGTVKLFNVEDLSSCVHESTLGPGCVTSLLPTISHTGYVGTSSGTLKRFDIRKKQGETVFQSTCAGIHQLVGFAPSYVILAFFNELQVVDVRKGGRVASFEFLTPCRAIQGVDSAQLIVATQKEILTYYNWNVPEEYMVTPIPNVSALLYSRETVIAIGPTHAQLPRRHLQTVSQ